MTEITTLFARWIGAAGAILATAAVAAQGDALLVTGNNVNVRAGPSTEAGILARVGIDEPAKELRRLGQWVEVELPEQDVLGWIHASLVVLAPPVAATQTAAAPASVLQDRSEPTPADQAADVAAASPATVSNGSSAAPVATSSPPVVESVSRDSAASPRAAAGGSAPEVAAVTAPATAGVPAAEVPVTAALSLFRSEVEHFNERAVAAAGIDLFTGVEPLGEGGVQVIATDAWAIMSRPGQQSYLNALFGRWQAATGGGQDLRLEIVDSTGALMMERTGP